MADLPPLPKDARPHTLVVAIEIGTRGANLDAILTAIRECEGVTDADECATFDHGDKPREEQCNVWIADTTPRKKFHVTINRYAVYEVLATDLEDAKDAALDGEGSEIGGETTNVEAVEVGACWNCNGTGKLSEDSAILPAGADCPVCKGTGKGGEK